MPEVLLSDDVARLLRYKSADVVSWAARRGKIPGVLPRQPGERWRFSRDAVLEFIRNGGEGAA